MAVRMWTVKIRPVCDIQNRIVHQPVGVGLIYMQIGLLGSQVQPQAVPRRRISAQSSRAVFRFMAFPFLAAFPAVFLETILAKRS